MFRILLSTAIHMFMLLGLTLIITLLHPDVLGMLSEPIKKNIIHVSPSDTIYTLSSQVFEDNYIQRWIFEYRYLVKVSSYHLQEGVYQLEEGEPFSQVIGHIRGE